MYGMIFKQSLLVFPSKEKSCIPIPKILVRRSGEKTNIEVSQKSYVRRRVLPSSAASSTTQN